MSKHKPEQPEDAELPNVTKSSEPTKKNNKARENLDIQDLEYDSEGLHIIDGDEVNKSEVISTGSLSLDVLLNGGYNSGFIQLWGPNSIGKTTLALNMGAQFQKFYNYENVRCYYHAVEGRWNPRLLSMVKDMQMFSPTETFIDEKDGKEKPRPIFRLSKPKNGETMYDFILKTVKQEKIKFFHIVDCIDNIKSVVNEGKNLSDAEKTASIATLNTRFGKEASIVTNHYGHVVLLIHQIRDKMQMGGSHVSGVGKQRSGGHMIEHIANLRLNFEKLWTDLYILENPSDPKSKIIGHMMRTTIDKVSSSGNRFQKLDIPFIYDKGIDRVREVASIGIGLEIITKDKNTYSFNKEKLGVGERQLLQSLKENDSLTNELEKEIRKLAGI